MSALQLLDHMEAGTAGDHAQRPTARRWAATVSVFHMPAPRTRNRRKSVRVRLKKITACIRQPGFGEEVVHVDDLSRGGLRFRSPKTYYQGSRIEVAVPYEPHGPNIFVLARIVWFRELPEANFKEYGATYVRP